MTAEERLQAFRQRFDAKGKDPMEVVNLLIEAMLAVEEDPKIAKHLLTVVMTKKELDEAPITISGFVLNSREEDVVRRLEANPNIARSYAGATPEKNYQDLDAAAPHGEIDRDYSPRAQGFDYPEPGQAKIFLKCGGADYPRPLFMARNNSGYWKVTDFSALAMGVKQGEGSGDF